MVHIKNHKMMIKFCCAFWNIESAANQAKTRGKSFNLLTKGKILILCATYKAAL
jgi:hypothetical protein